MHPNRNRSGLKSVLNRAAVVRVRNVLNPHLWLTAVATPVSFGFAWLAGFETAAGVFLLGLGCLPVISAIIAYAGYSIVNADRLQSEEFQIKQQELRLVEKQGTVLDLTAVPSSEDPEALGACINH